MSAAMPAFASSAALSFHAPARHPAQQMGFRLTASVREIPFRSTGMAQDSGTVQESGMVQERRFTAWRGRSGRRYVASVFAIADETALGFVDGVLLAVGPDREIVAARDSGPFGVESALSRWRDAAMGAGATQIHVHLLADGASERRRALIDLTPDA